MPCILNSLRCQFNDFIFDLFVVRALMKRQALWFIVIISVIIFFGKITAYAVLRVWVLRTKATSWVPRTLTFFLDYMNFINHLYFTFLIRSFEQDKISTFPLFFRRTLPHHKVLIVIVKCLYIICHLLLFAVHNLLIVLAEIVLRVPRGRKRFTL